MSAIYIGQSLCFVHGEGAVVVDNFVLFEFTKFFTSDYSFYDIMYTQQDGSSLMKSNFHYSDVIMGEMASQTTGVSIVYQTVCQA